MKDQYTAAKNKARTSCKKVVYYCYSLLLRLYFFMIQLVLILFYNLYDAGNNGPKWVTINLNDTLVPLPKNVKQMKQIEMIHYKREIEVTYKIAREVIYIKDIYYRHSSIYAVMWRYK